MRLHEKLNNGFHVAFLVAAVAAVVAWMAIKKPNKASNQKAVMAAAG
jgi:hypothetical protein